MKLSTTLMKQAQELRSQSPEYVAISMLKQAGMDDTDARTEVAQTLMEKEAANFLTASGIDYDAAMELVKAAGVKVKDLEAFTVEKSSEELLAETLEKAAGLAEALEERSDDVEVLLEKIAELEARLEETSTIERETEPMAKFAQSGAFTNEDLKAMRKLPTDTLTKIASSQEQPWRMGKSAGQNDIGSLDPLAQFCLG